MTERELFKEAVMQYMVDDTRIQRESKKRKSHPAMRRILFAAAGLVVALGITVFAIPSARAAVEEWLNGVFTPRDYIGEEKTERTKEPTIDAIITSADVTAAVVGEVGSGYEAYAKAFDMTLDEIAYDGTSIFLSGTMSGATARPFVEASTGGDTFRAEPYDGSVGGDDDWEYYYFSAVNNVDFVIDDGRTYDGEIVPTYTDEMNAICASLANQEHEDVFKNGVLVSSNPEADKLWDAYLADHDVRFSIKLSCDPDVQPLSGQVGGKLSLRMWYDNVASKSPVKLLNASFSKIIVDADAYLAQTKTTQAKAGTSVTLGGVHPVTIEEWQPVSERKPDQAEIYCYTHEFDFTGATVSLKEISFTPTDTKIVLHVTLPEGWTSKELATSSLAFHFLFDGKKLDSGSDVPFMVCGPFGTNDVTGATLEYDCSFYESSLSPSQWADFKTLTIIPTTVYWWDMKARYDDEAPESVSLRDGNVFTEYANHTGIEADYLYDEMTQYAITIPLDDYR